MHGAVDAAEKGLVDAEMITRWTSARLGVLLDKLTLEDWAELQDDPDKRRKAIRGSSVELRAAARLTEAATRHERALHYLSLPVDDVFDALDPLLLADRYGFPGHAEARAQAEANETHWKVFYKERYGIDPMNADQLRQVAVAMRHHGGELSQQLAALKPRVIRLSFGEKD
jgi:hypothetical protein